MKAVAAVALLLLAAQTYPPPFPRLGVVKVFENDYVVVWDAQFPTDVHTGMHEHKRDAAAYFVTAGQVIATFPDGTVRKGNPFPSGNLLFNPHGVIHSEQWISVGTKAIAMELKGDSVAQVSPPPPGADPLTAEPTAHRVLLENERVRILETVQRAGAGLREHSHPARMVVRFPGCEGLPVPASASRTSGGPQVWWAGAESHSHQAPTADCKSLEFEVKGAR